MQTTIRSTACLRTARNHRKSRAATLRRSILATSVAALLLSAASPASADVLYGATGGKTASALYVLDSSNGATISTVGQIGFSVTGLAFNPTSGILYGVTSNKSPGTPNALITINPQTGAGTFVGTLGTIIADIAFDGAGQLFGWDQNNSSLATINPATGTATSLPFVGFSTYGNALSFNKAGVLFYTGNGDTGNLRALNTTTGASTDVATLTGGIFNGGSLSAGAFNSADAFFASDNNFGNSAAHLVKINVATGAITDVGASLTGLDAIAFSLPATHWVGGVATDGKWTSTNWGFGQGGVATTGVPDSATDVTFSANNVAGSRATTLEQDFTIKSLTVNDTTAVSIASGTDTKTLTISDAAGTGITVAPGANLTISSNVTLAGASDTIAVNGTGQATISGALASTTASKALIKTGTGTLTLSGTNTYTGVTTINGGTLSLLGGAAIFNGPAGGAVVLANVAGARLDLQSSETIGSLAGGGALGGNTTLNGNTLTTGNNASTTYFGSISGTGGLTKVRAATNFTLAGINTYTGPTNINAGTITLNGGDAIVDPSVVNPTAGAVIVAAGGTLALTAPETIGTLSGPVAGSNVNLNNSTLTLGVAGIAGGNTTFAGTITDLGGGSIIKNSADAFTLSGNTSTYAAGTTLNAGTLNINSSSTAGLASGPVGTGVLNINGGTIGTTTNGGGTNFNTIANAVNLNADFSVSNVVGAVNRVNPLNGGLVTDGVTFSGPVSINQPNITINTLGGYLDFTGVISQSAPGNGLTFTGNTFTQIGAGGAGDAPNTYTGTTNLQSGGILLNKGAAVAGADGLAIPGNLNISPGAVVQVLSRTLNASVANNQISPTATVTVNGTLDLGGTNQTINSLAGAGTIRLDDSVVNVQWGATFGGPAALRGAGTLTVNSGSFTGAIVDAGAVPGRGQVVKNTAGTLNLFGASGYTGGTTLNAGTLGVGHTKALGSGNLTINGGTLQTLGGPLVLNLGGGNIQGNGGTVVFNVGGTVAGASHDQLLTTGAASINGTTLALLQQNGFVLQIGDKITLVSAAAGVAGGTATGTAVAAGSVTGLAAFSNNPLLVPTVNLYTSSVVLEATQGSFLALSSQLNLTGNQLAVARVLDGVAASIGNKTGIYQELTYLSTQPLSTLQGNLDKLVPEELVAIFSGSVALANIQTANLQRHMEDVRTPSSAPSASGMAAAGSGPSYSGGMSAPTGKRSKEIRPPDGERWGMFLTGSGEWTRVGSTTNAAGYQMETGGVTAGVDYRVSTNLAIGLDLGYVGTTASLVNNGKVRTDGGRLGLFATYFDQNFHVDAAVTGGLNSYRTSRTTPNNTAATGRPDGSEINVLVAAGYDWKFGGLTVGPTASYQHTNVHTDGFTETGTFAPLRVAGQTAESSRTALGIRASFDAKVRGVCIRPELKLAWQHEFGDNGFSITSNFATLGGNAFTVSGPATGRDALLIGTGCSILWTDRFATYLYYDGEVGRSNYESHGVSGGVRIQF